MGFFDHFFRSGNEEFAAELSNKRHDASLNDSYSHNGVWLNEAANTLRLVYNGILAESGAHSVYSVIGYGNNLKWEDVDYYPMHKIGPQTYELVFPVKKPGNINVAFKDGASNWDNNSGRNYKF